MKFKPTNWFCRRIGHREGTKTIFPDGVLRCNSNRCYICGTPVPKELRSEYLTLDLLRWKDES